ncbi:MAG TPA: alpha/beta hydrolase [Desulfurivibrionaceae bacterium]|nr:alpha/beta hydrolase [Desulfurivibrionaceae bacterium]
MSRLALQYDKLDQPGLLRVLFHPRPEWTPPPPGAVDQEVAVAPGILVTARAFLGAPLDQPALLFFHGNGEVVSDYDAIGPLFNEVGLHFIAVEYRGYGKSGGTPTVSAMIDDAHVLLAAVREQLKAAGHTGHLLVMGRSLGSVPALELAAAGEPGIDGLIIESGIGHTIPFLLGLGVDVATYGITSEADGFKNVQKIALFRKPTYILHAQHDAIIPLAGAEMLQVECGAHSKEFQMVPGADHNTIIACAGKVYFQAIKQFTKKVGQARRPRRPGVRT